MIIFNILTTHFMREVIQVPKKIKDAKLNQKRMGLLAKGYLDKSDIKVFVPCGNVKAREIYNSIRNQVTSEGLENLREVILAKRILKFMGLTTESIKAAAKAERKGISL